MKRPCAALALILLLALGCSPESASEAEAASARPAPAFDLDQLGGGSVSLAALRGKTVVLDFWATWCPPCEFQVPALNQFYEAHRSDSDVALFGVSVDSEGPDVVGSWVADKDVRYPILLGGEDLARRFGAIGFPTLFVLTPDGRVHAQHVGLIEVEVLEQALAAQRGDDPI